MQAGVIDRNGNRTRQRIQQSHIIFIQREACFFGTSYFERRAYRSGAYVICDFDDSIWLADTSPTTQSLAPIR